MRRSRLFLHAAMPATPNADALGAPRARIIRLAGPSAVLVVLAVACILPFVLDSFRAGQVASVFYLAVAVLSMNLLTGMTGQVSLGQAAFFGIGAYTVALLVQNHGWSYPAAIAMGVVIAAVCGLVVGIPALRIRGLYVALTTLAVGLVFPELLQKFSGSTGGSSGLTVSAAMSPPAGSGLTIAQWAYFVSLLLTLIVFVLVRNIRAGRIGRALLAVRDHEEVAESFGISLARAKVTAFAVSAALAGLAGGMFLLQQQFVSPGDFQLSQSIDFFVGMAIGGSTSVVGALIGGVFLEYATPVIQGAGLDPAWTPVVYGAVLIVVIYLLPDGVAGGVSSLTRRLFDGGLRRVAEPSVNGPATRADDSAAPAEGHV